MDEHILNLEQAVEFIGVSEKTLIKLLREEHIPARKIGREWRFSRDALIGWLASGDSMDYVNREERYIVSEDTSGVSHELFGKIMESLSTIKKNGSNIASVLQGLEKDITIPEESTLRVSYKQQRDVEKLEFKIFWEMREESKLEPNQKTKTP